MKLILFIYLFIYIFIYLFTYLFIYLHIYLFIYIFIRWPLFTIPVGKLCSGDWDRTLKITIWDWNKLVGCIECIGLNQQHYVETYLSDSSKRGGAT